MCTCSTTHIKEDYCVDSEVRCEGTHSFYSLWAGES